MFNSYEMELYSVCSLAGQYDKYGFVPARLAENRYLVSLKDLQIRALAGQYTTNRFIVPSQAT